MVEAEYSAEALVTLNRMTGQGSGGRGLRKSALMIALGVVVRHELSDCVLTRCRSEEDHPAQTFFLNGTHEPLCQPVQIGRLWRQWNDLDALHLRGELIWKC